MAYQAFAQKQSTPFWVGEFGENSYEMIRTTVEMYDRCPAINGWAFWTWKKAPSKSPGLVVIKVPKDWEAVMASVGSLFGGEMPDPATVRTGIKEFIEAMKFKNTSYDLRMERASLPSNTPMSANGARTAIHRRISPRANGPSTRSIPRR